MANAASLTSPGLAFAGDKAILAARKSLEFVSLFATDFSAEAVQPGTSLMIPVFGGAATTFAPGSAAGYNDSEGTVKWAAVTFSTHKKCTFGFTDKDALLVETNPLWARCGKAAGDAVGAALVTSVTGLLTYSAREAAVSSWSLGSTDASARAAMAGLRASCATNGYDPAKCVVILAPADYATVIAALPANVIGDGSAVITGIAPGLFGFKAVVEGNTISTDSAASTAKGHGFIVPEDAIAVGARIIKPQDGVCEEWGTTTDEITGLTLGHRITVDQNRGERFYTVEALLGAALTKQSSNGAPGFLQLVAA